MHFFYIGYSDESKAYRLYNPNSSKLVISKDVIFDEMATWKWDDEQVQVPKIIEKPKFIQRRQHLHQIQPHQDQLQS